MIDVPLSTDLHQEERIVSISTPLYDLLWSIDLSEEKCMCHRRELDNASLATFDWRDGLFFDDSGEGDNSSRVALYAGDFCPSSL